jgi:hypothetical protein
MTAALEDAVRSAGDRVTDRILALSHDLHAHPEIDAGAQEFRYLDCHSRTGVLGAVSSLPD